MSNLYEKPYPTDKVTEESLREVLGKKTVDDTISLSEADRYMTSVFDRIAREMVFAMDPANVELVRTIQARIEKIFHDVSMKEPDGNTVHFVPDWKC